MKSTLDDLQSALRGFVEQRDNLLMVVGTTDLEVIYALKAVEAIDRGTDSDVCLVFGTAFRDAASYVTAVANDLRAQIEGTTKALVERGPLPPLPAVCADLGTAPAVRLRAAVDHVSALIPVGGGHHVLWAFLPLQIHDQEGYARLMGEFVPWKGPALWMRGLRVIARDDRAHPFLSPGLRANKAPGVWLYDLDLSPAAINDGLVRDAADRSAPVAQRMQAIMQLAGLDYAHERYAQAMEKYVLLYRYYAEHTAVPMQAMCLQGIGDCFRRMGDVEGARTKYQQALTLAAEAKSLPVLLHLTYSLGEVSVELGRDHDADGYFGLADQLAARVMNPFVKADALECQGIVRERLGDRRGAVESWQAAQTVCKTYGYDERHRTVLERLVAAYARSGQDAERRACEAELTAVRQALRATEKAHDHHPLKGAT